MYTTSCLFVKGTIDKPWREIQWSKCEGLLFQISHLNSRWRYKIKSIDYTLKDISCEVTSVQSDLIFTEM